MAKYPTRMDWRRLSVAVGRQRVIPLPRAGDDDAAGERGLRTAERRVIDDRLEAPAQRLRRVAGVCRCNG